MATSAASNQVVFLHFPKTAGTALAQLLIDDDTDRLAVSQWPEAERELDSFELVHGHLRFDQLDRLAPSSTRITMLRHPIERIMSLHAFHRRRPDDPMYEIANTLSLGEFVEAGHGTDAYVSMLTDRVVDGELLPATGSRADRYELAVERLDTFDCIGITEFFEYSLVLVARALGRPPIWRRSTANSAPEPTTRTSLDGDTLRTVRQHAGLDIRLYEHALERFKAAMHDLVSVPARPE